MNTSFLICESKLDDIKELKKDLETLKLEHDIVSNGKDAQLKLFKKKYQIVLLDIKIQNNSSIEVLKYIKQNSTNTKVVLVFDSKEEMKEYDLDQKDLNNLSILSIFRPYTTDNLLKLISENLKMFSWNIPLINNTELYKSLILNDNNFTKINIHEFIPQNSVMFDLYIRLAKDKYVKIVNRGEELDSDRLMDYAIEKEIPHLYFLTKERAQFIGCLNALSNKIIHSHQYKTNQKISIMDKTCQLYIEDIYTQGLSSDSLDEGIKICDNIFNIIRQEQDISEYFKELESQNITSLNQSFLTALFCSIICKHIHWASKNTTDKLLIAAFLHNLGKLKLPHNLKQKNIWELDEKEKSLYFQYINQTLQMLGKCKTLPSAVLLIIAQHHEYINSKGFPLKLPGIKIYPLAKILCFASEFADFLIYKKIDVKSGLQIFLQDKENLEKYDPLIIKSFVLGFSGKKV